MRVSSSRRTRATVSKRGCPSSTVWRSRTGSEVTPLRRPGSRSSRRPLRRRSAAATSSRRCGRPRGFRRPTSSRGWSASSPISRESWVACTRGRKAFPSRCGRRSPTSIVRRARGTILRATTRAPCSRWPIGSTRSPGSFASAFFRRVRRTLMVSGAPRPAPFRSPCHAAGGWTGAGS